MDDDKSTLDEFTESAGPTPAAAGGGEPTGGAGGG